jgi:hypothetical protein
MEEIKSQRQGQTGDKRNKSTQRDTTEHKALVRAREVIEPKKAHGRNQK